MPATPTEVFHALVDGVPRLMLGDPSGLDGLAALYAGRTHVSHPFGDTPVLTSRDQLREHFRGITAAGFDRAEAVDRVVHATADPEVVIGEFRYTGLVRGRPFSVPCIFVLRVRDGEIVESRDYADHGAFARTEPEARA